MEENEWKFWSEHILKHVSSLEENVKNINLEIKESNKNINSICIRLEELTRVNDKINTFKEDYKSIKEDYKPIKEEMNVFKNDLIALKIKSGFWGAISGTLATIATGLIYFLTKAD